MPLKDPEAKRQYMREWRAKNPDKMKASSQRRAPKEKLYRRANKERYAELQRQRRARLPEEHLVLCARYRAKRDGLPCNITVENIVWPTHCPVLGVELDYSRTEPGERTIRTNSPTLDRRTNELGYVVGNVFVISHRANRIKSDATVEELFKVATYASGLCVIPSPQS
jgi:hypothetical protein